MAKQELPGGHGVARDLGPSAALHCWLRDPVAKAEVLLAIGQRPALQALTQDQADRLRLAGVPIGEVRDAGFVPGIHQKKDVDRILR